ncbi:hypothetical protein CCMA1212_004565 [Trichoderma ghanense]|uniref:Uncharacterized protein n=1 Tax=Trichoderma ghanense TaxID=65468 RepID=A0ABY2H567_9HYPO
MNGAGLWDGGHVVERMELFTASPQCNNSCHIQPVLTFDSPSYQYQRSDHDAPPSHDSCNAADVGDDENATSSTSLGGQTQASEINISCLKNTVTWRDVNDRDQHSDHVNLDIYSEASTNTAMFKLHCDVRFKGTKGKKSNKIQTIYLFIYPETIRAVTLKSNLDLLAPSCSLQFSLTQPPSLIVPADDILQCKPQTKGLFGLMHSLAEVTDFTIQLNNSLKTIPILPALERVVHLFSTATDRPRSNVRYADIATLYCGRGGKIFNVKAAAARAGEAEEADDASLPVYTASASDQASHKRQRKDSSPSGPRSPAPHERMLLLLESMNTSISRMESRLDSMEGRLDSMDGRFEHLNSRLDDMESLFERVESNVLDAVQSNYSPCRFGTEERTEMLEEIDDKIEERTLEIKIDCEEMLKDVENDAEKAIEELQEEVRETLEQLEESVEENTERLVKQGLRTKLENASLRFDGTVFLET